MNRIDAVWCQSSPATSASFRICTSNLLGQNVNIRLQKCGDDLAMRIPGGLAAQIGLEPDAPVELSLRGTELVIKRFAPSETDLDDLLAGVTEHNLHCEVDTGSPMGREVW